MSCYPKITVAGATTEMHTAKLFITYEYDEGAQTQIKTVRYFVGSTGNLAANGSVQWTHYIDIPESGVTIRDKWYETRGRVEFTGCHRYQRQNQNRCGCGHHASVDRRRTEERRADVADLFPHRLLELQHLPDPDRHGLW
jgi:hypothetical protein